MDVSALERGYYARHPDVEDANQRVAFGTSGHRGTPLDGTLTEAHILASVQAVCDYRRAAEVHFWAGYVPPHHPVEVFAQALRAIGEELPDRRTSVHGVADTHPPDATGVGEVPHRT